MVWIVTTKFEEYRLCNSRMVIDFTKAIRRSVGIIYVSCKNDLHLIDKEDLVFVRTKQQSIIEWCHSLGCLIIGEDYETIIYDDKKGLFKDLLIQYKIKTPKTIYSTLSIDKNKKYFVKPNNLGDSIGIDSGSICTNATSINKRIEYIKKTFNTDALVEEYLCGSEYTVSILKINNGIVIGCVKITNENDYIDFETKVHDKEVYEVSNRNDVINMAINAFKLLNAKHIARIDIKCDENDVPYILEVNLCPGLSKDGYLAKCLNVKTEEDYKRMIDAIVLTSRLTNVTQ